MSRIEVRRLSAGDSVTLDGVLCGLRDATPIRIFDDGQAPPGGLQGAACMQTAPKIGDRYEPVSAGTTISMRIG